MQKCYYHAIMFDFDGTLVQTMHDYAEIAAEEMNSLYGLPVKVARQLYLETSGIPFYKQLEVIFGPDGKNTECAKRFEGRKAPYLENVELSHDTVSTIQDIRDLGVSIAITSNNFQEILDRFVANGPELFDIVIGYGNGFSKGPTQFTKVIDSFGVDRRHILFIGDSLTDVRKALAFGVDFVAIAGTLKPESFTSLFMDVPVVFSLGELKNLLTTNKPVIASKEG